MYPEPTGLLFYALLWGLPTLALFLGAWVPHLVDAVTGAHPEDAQDPPATFPLLTLGLLLATGVAVLVAEVIAGYVIGVINGRDKWLAFEAYWNRIWVDFVVAVQQAFS